MSSRPLRDEALEKEDRIEKTKKKKKKKKTLKNSPTFPHLLQAQQAPALPYAKVVGCPGTGSYPAPSPDPTTRHTQVGELKVIFSTRLENPAIYTCLLYWYSKFADMKCTRAFH